MTCNGSMMHDVSALLPLLMGPHRPKETGGTRKLTIISVVGPAPNSSLPRCALEDG
jgi:hypothetical protein